MRREEFQYPAAPKGCMSLARWQAAPKAQVWVGGIYTGESLLASATHIVQVNMPKVRVLEPGDTVAVFVTSWELAPIRIEASDLILLAPAKRDRPPVLNADILQLWPQFLREVRSFFTSRHCLEMTTPSLVTCPGLEPSLEPMKISNGNRGFGYLPTSPEIHLKKALALGFTDIFEIKLCFRAGENGHHHQPEFHMLEWYRSFADLSLIEEDLTSLTAHLSNKFSAQIHHGRGSPDLASSPCGLELPPTIAHTSFAALFREHLEFPLTPQTNLAELVKLADHLKIQVSKTDSFDDVFHRIFIDKIEPLLIARGPLIINGFPPSQAALARLTSDGWADRFEFYWRGLEIANAFHEVNDPAEQNVRWQQELDERHRLGTTEIPIDDDLLKHLQMGMPPTGGIALGLERLFMAIFNVSNIRNVKLFS